MRIALVAPPFLPVPPRTYGGTELFLSHLAGGLVRIGHEVIVYANGESRVPCELRSRYLHSEWPLPEAGGGTLKSLEHEAWSLEDALAEGVDVVHLNDALGIPFTRFLPMPAVLTLHHPYDETLLRLYEAYPEVNYVAISRCQLGTLSMPRRVLIHHGLDTAEYQLQPRKQPYLAFLGRIAPCKGAHLAIEVARAAGIPLKIAGEIQPAFRDYWKTQVEPHVDGRAVEYVGEADHALKNELLGHALALLFPIQWEEPFGLVMIEAMACGTPVIALARGSVPEIIQNGVSGWICRTPGEMVNRLKTLDLDAATCRAYVETHFTNDLMIRRYADLYHRAAGAAVPREISTSAWQDPGPVCRRGHPGMSDLDDQAHGSPRRGTPYT